MDQTQAPAQALRIHTAISHRVRTLTIRDDLLGWVISGRKTLTSPLKDIHFPAGKVFLVPRHTQWEVINEAQPGGHYEARIISFSPSLIEGFYQRFGQFTVLAKLQGCAITQADQAFATTFEHASAALSNPVSSIAMREHCAQEMLLLLAERGLGFPPPQSLSWSDRVYRLVGQRPDAPWTSEMIAQAFHMSSSSLQRRLAEEGSSLGRCVRDVRLETALTLLQSSQLAIAEIAARCGYASHSRFSAAFRERFGYTPSHLRP
ncbi:MAG: helix-turn-helix transcriptional regulator [Rhodocyclales bacterium]|nr:helix-turn-helix transcriptional regulator [Rhodocyclales bacterium]